MPRPLDRCCCSHFAHRGVSPWCCGPPIRAAARGTCFFLLIITLLRILQGISAFVGEQDECVKTSPDTVIVASVAISIVAVLIYGWGMWVAHTGSVSHAQLLWKAHTFISCLSILVGVCMTGNYAKSPRIKDPVLDARCRAECEADADISERPWLYSGDPCDVPDGVVTAWIAAVIFTAIWGYFAFVLWSFAKRAKEGTMEMLHGTQMAVMTQVAVPQHDFTARNEYPPAPAMAIPVAVAVAVPVPVGIATGTAVPLTVTAVPLATAITSDPNSSTSPPYSPDEPPPAYNAEARYEHAQPPPAYATAPESEATPPRYPV